MREAVNSWIGRLFDRENLDATAAALVASQQDGGRDSAAQKITKRRLADAETRLRRFQAAIASGVDPAALVDVINQAQAECAMARAESEATPTCNLLSDAEVYAMVDALGDVGTALSAARPGSLVKLYTALDLQVRYEPSTHAPTSASTWGGG